MRQAANLHHLELPMLLLGITIDTSPTDFAPIKQVQMERFDGKRFIRFGPILSGTID
jgi:branched-chain amino acid transport system substrate-binding protein